MKMVENSVFYLGYGLKNEFINELNNYKFNKIFLITDKGLVKANVHLFITNILDELGINYLLYDDVHPNPSIKDVQNGVDSINNYGGDLIIAIGGGSVMDTSKAISLISNNKEHYDVESLEEENISDNEGLTLFAFPTTAGTGSETTLDFVITNEREKRKMACRDTKAVPKVAFLDAELMENLPSTITAATGMDALTHAIESYVCKGANKVSDFYSLKAIKLIADNLKKCTFDGKNIEARENMAFASYLAGRSFTNVGLGIVHSLAHPLSAYFGTPHGIANALMLPFVMEYNLDSNLKKFKDIAIALGVGDNNRELNDKEIAILGIEKVRKMLTELKLPTTLHEIKFDCSKLDELSKSAFADLSTADNPKDVSVRDLKNLYIKAL